MHRALLKASKSARIAAASCRIPRRKTRKISLKGRIRVRYILHDHIGSANHGCEALVRTVSKLLGPGRTVLLSEAPEEDADTA